MAVPKRRTSRAKQRSRAAHTKVASVSPATCPECGEVRLPHRMCPSCGYYNKREIVKPREE